MDIRDKQRQLRLLIAAATAFGCSIAALSGTLHAQAYQAKLAAAAHQPSLG